MNSADARNCGNEQFKAILDLGESLLTLSKSIEFSLLLNCSSAASIKPWMAVTTSRIDEKLKKRIKRMRIELMRQFEANSKT